MPLFSSIGRTVLSPARFVIAVIAELKEVSWPSGKDTARFTALVIGLSLIVGGWIGGLDYFFTRTLGTLLR